ncbi:putative copper resistance-associated P-type ATPase [Aspergillus stella-maris]|uniref:putative copper resistance-associated P-type ATPase n=1 Tax=Aspergillus stella-maris TaxID=1810926 RepID=UPI003CCDC258
MAAKFTEYHRSTFFVSNVHCSSCVAYINQVLSKVPEVSKSGIDVSIFTHEVHVVHSRRTDPLYLAKVLTHAAFEVHHVTTRTPTGAIVADHDTDTRSPRDSILLATGQSLVAGRREKQKHLANCDVCRNEEAEWEVEAVDEKSQHLLSAPGPVPQSETIMTIDEKPASSEEKWNAQMSIGGMSCASCSNSIENEISQLEYVDKITVTLLSNSGTVTFSGPRSNADEIVEHIEDMGFEASLDEVNPVAVKPLEESTSYIAEVAIGGMTCGACSGTVNEALNELPFVIHAVVNLMKHNAQVELDDQANGQLIVEKIEDLGFDASLVSIVPKTVEKNSSIEKRTVSFRVEGMFCHHCPDRVLNSLKGIPGLELGGSFSDKNPIIKITYMPSAPSLTVRTIREKIENAHDAFKVTVYRPPSVEDRSREMQHHERRRLLSRFLFVLAAAIPEFIIGIVFMSLVPSDNSVRQYLEQAMWSGSVTRMEWALFIMTTPVMFYGTDVFHVRAAKEIITLWRPGSRVPLLRRFFRFGSMNLLISAGTLVAYVSSVAILIMDAVTKATHSMHSTTYFDTVVFLTLFILAGRYMEAYSKGKAGDAVASLGNLRPSEALLVLNDNGSDAAESQRVSVDLLEVGDTVRVPHGASPPADGKVTGSGTYQFNESSLTGESKPVNKVSGDQVYTGSVNVGQPVEFEITAIGGSSMLDQIIAVVREGQSKRAPLERVADVLVSHFVPVITLIAILTFVVWVSLGVSGTLPDDYLDVNRGGWVFWALEFAIAVFVVACPCGLALAAPTALFVGGGLAARYGILVKGGGEAFQEASRLSAIVFDKTGTLTEGDGLQVSDHETLVKDSDKLQVAWAVARKLEESSNHPIAQAIHEFCKAQPAASIISSDIEEKPGMGMQGTFTISVSGSTRKFEAAIGNQRQYQALSSPDQNQDHYYLNTTLSKYQSTGRSTAILCLRELRNTTASEKQLDLEKPLPVPEEEEEEDNFTPALIFAISDKIRPDAVSVISALQSRKIDVFMCTGDNEITAHAVAAQLGIPRTNVLANTLPAGKADFIRQVQSGQHVPRLLQPSQREQQDPNRRAIVAFVGDGVNDSPALTASDVSIAMASGSDVAMNSASFILLNSELSTILNLALLSRKVINRIKMNFCWAVVYNACLIPVAAGVFYPIVSGHKQEMKMSGDGSGMVSVSINEHWRLSPVWAALAMALSSVSVVCSSLLLAVDRKAVTGIWGKVKGKLGSRG